jgi:hypothetical protein
MAVGFRQGKAHLRSVRIRQTGKLSTEQVIREEAGSPIELENGRKLIAERNA